MTVTSLSDPAVERLTAKERECLERWLGHATAKEIALELGITHHAVEKRLKSARQKLGATSTLEAARQLAAASAPYGRTASQPPELLAAAPPGQDPTDQRVATTRWRHPWLIAGAFSMIVLLASTLALTTAAAPEPAASPQTRVITVDRKDGRGVDLASAAGTVFATLDKNGDKVLSGDELTRPRFQLIRSGGTGGQPAEVNSLSAFDRDGDGRVTEAEFRAGMAGLATLRPS